MQINNFNFKNFTAFFLMAVDLGLETRTSLGTGEQQGALRSDKRLRNKANEDEQVCFFSHVAGH